MALRGKIAGYNFFPLRALLRLLSAPFPSLFRLHLGSLEVGARLIITITLLLGSELRVKMLSEELDD